MRRLFQFSIRDWLWLSIVLILAVGWARSVHYSQWISDNSPDPITEGENKGLKSELNRARAELYALSAYKEAVKKSTTAGEQKNIDKIMDDFYKTYHVRPGKYKRVEE